ncbi:MAG TPA: hypothetical protein VFP84_33105 [Kofleriaceae bacterium]|nr:hypothetical protein [Kofleriaceae bacterium]
MDGKRPFNAEYVALMQYFGMRPRAMTFGAKVQNGDVEARRRVQELARATAARALQPRWLGWRVPGPLLDASAAKCFTLTVYISECGERSLICAQSGRSGASFDATLGSMTTASPVNVDRNAA